MRSCPFWICYLSFLKLNKTFSIVFFHKYYYFRVLSKSKDFRHSGTRGELYFTDIFIWWHIIILLWIWCFDHSRQRSACQRRIIYCDGLGSRYQSIFWQSAYQAVSGTAPLSNQLELYNHTPVSSRIWSFNIPNRRHKAHTHTRKPLCGYFVVQISSYDQLYLYIYIWSKSYNHVCVCICSFIWYVCLIFRQNFWVLWTAMKFYYDKGNALNGTLKNSVFKFFECSMFYTWTPSNRWYPQINNDILILLNR